MYLSQQACCQCYSCNLDFPSVSISLYGFFLFNHPQTHTHTHLLTVHICPQSRTHYYCTSKCYRSPRHPYTPPFSNFWNSTAYCASPPHLPLSPQASLQPPPHPPHPTGHSLPAHTHSSRVQQEPGLYGNSVTKCQSNLWALCVEQSARHPHMLPSRYTASWLFSTAIVVQLPPSELYVCVCHMSFKWVALLCTAFLSPLFFSGQSLSSFSNFYSNSFMQVQRLHPKHTIPSLHLGLEPLKYTWLALHSFILLNLYF